MLSTNTQQKLDRITEIKDQINNLELELDEIFGEVRGQVVAVAQVRGKSDAAKPVKKDVTTPNKQPCPECGSMRRHFKTCSKNPSVAEKSSAPADLSELSSIGSSMVTTSPKIKKLILQGLDDEQIARDTGCMVRTVSFIRKQMKSRSEI